MVGCATSTPTRQVGLNSAGIGKCSEPPVCYKHDMNKLKDDKVPRVVYAAINIINPLDVVRVVPQEYLKGKIVQKAFHVTTMFLGGKPPSDKEMFESLQRLEGSHIELKPIHIVSDSEATAIQIRNEGEFPCANTYPHITVATAPGVPAKYSNELLCKASAGAQDVQITETLPDVSFQGVFQFVR